MKGLALGYERFARIALMIFVVQVAFLAHTLLGAVVAGFFPSTAAANSTFRTWLLSIDRSWTATHTWTVFHRAWKTELGAANAFGWPQAAIGVLLAWEYYVVNWNDTGLPGVIVSGLLLVANIAYIVFVAISWPVRATLEGPAGWIVRVTLRLMIVRPLCSAAIIALLLTTAWAWYSWPGILVTFGLSAPIFSAAATVYFLGRLPGMSASRTVTSIPARKDLLRTN
ncbi:MAG: hypothetical protein K0S70_896 [Microbacterium sp.]|jgi:uncharacterized membrane protein YesL|nr:hypothetical protein [Microbacterium sp.]